MSSHRLPDAARQYAATKKLTERNNYTKSALASCQ